MTVITRPLHRYNAKVARHTAGLSDDPLAASPFDAASQSIRADLSRGLGFDDSHPLAIAAKAGALYSAELAVGVWLLEHPQTSYQSSMGVLAGVIALALTADGAKLSNEDEAEGSGDADHVDCYCLLEALLEALHYLLFENASSNMTSPLEAWYVSRSLIERSSCAWKISFNLSQYIFSCSHTLAVSNFFLALALFCLVQ